MWYENKVACNAAADDEGPLKNKNFPHTKQHRQVINGIQSSAEKAQSSFNSAFYILFENLD